jgi:hypothetical protein
MDSVAHLLKLSGWLSVLKLAAILVAGILGAASIPTDYKDEQGKLTRWGKFALGGIIVSTLIAVAAQTIETRLDNQKRAEDAADISSLLREIRRAVYPLQNMEVGYQVSFAGSAPELAAYKKRVLGFIAEISASHAKLKANPEAANVVTVAPGVKFVFAGWEVPSDIANLSPQSPKIDSIDITSDSTLYPDAKHEASFAPALTECGGLLMSFYQARKREAKEQQRSDLLVWTTSGKAELMYFPSEDAFVKGCSSHTEMHHSNGSITSMEDLANALVVIFQSFDSMDYEGPDFTLLQKLMAKGKLQSLFVTIAGRAVIDTFNLQVYQIAESDPFSASTPESIYQFPADVAEGKEPEPFSEK